MAPRTKAIEGTPNEVKLAEAVLNHKTKIVELTARVKLIENDNETAFASLQHTNAALIERVNAMEAHIGTLTATSINAARYPKQAPHWYRPWMGGLALGLLLVVLFTMTISAKREAAKANAWTAKADSQCNNTRRILDSLHQARAQEREVVLPPRKSKRAVVIDAVPAADASTAPAVVPAGTPAVGGTN